MTNDESKLTGKLELDRVCVEFEKLVRSGENPDIESYLAIVDKSARETLLQHLLEIELEYQRENSRLPSLENLRERFPDHSFVVRGVHEALSGGARQIGATEPLAPADDSHHDSTPSGSSLHGRFEPGQRVAGRYRIVSLLGKGGMGEVYRADDLVLGQPVALKFLPEDFSYDSKRLEYFFSEVRLARQVSHPNVCRVHDIGEVDGQHFISMEFIDGEDLKTLLKRMGRPQQDKAIEMAKQLCGGLAAAHTQGVIHRDLKPANVMIDGRGQVRITDFGLATVLEDDRSQHSLVGTPAYMAPEQLLNGETSERSDIYSLGLVLYELFTGQVARDQRQSVSGDNGSAISSPSEVCDGVDPHVERVLVKCLQDSIHQRPASVSEIIGFLPGADPIAAALAAGRTPTPAVVASAGGTGALSATQACIMTILGLIGLATYFILDGITPPGFKTAPDRLVHFAESILSIAGHSSENTPYAEYGYRIDADGVNSTDLEHRSEFWYRRSPKLMIPHQPEGLGRSQARVVTLHNPPPMLEKMVSLRLSSSGKLKELYYVVEQAPEVFDDSASVSEITWSELFSTAGQEYKHFRSETPSWTGINAASRRHAWVKEDGIRIEAASMGKRVTYFQLIMPNVTTRSWTTDVIDGKTTWGATAMPYVAGLGETHDASLAFGSLFWLIMPFALVIAFRNYRMNRCDTQGSLILGVIVGLTRMISMWIEAGHAANFTFEMAQIDQIVGRSLVVGFGIAILYAAIEPIIRRHLPHTIVSWSRALSGNLLDTMVARDALIGSITSIAFAFIPLFSSRIRPTWIGEGIVFIESRQLLANIPGAIPWALIGSLFFLTIVMLLTIVTRRLWGGCLLFIVVVVAASWPTDDDFWLKIINGIAALIALALLVRWGLVAHIGFGLTSFWIARGAIDHDLSVWYAQLGLMQLSLVAVWLIFLGWQASSPTALPTRKFSLS